VSAPCRPAHPTHSSQASILGRRGALAADGRQRHAATHLTHRRIAAPAGGRDAAEERFRPVYRFRILLQPPPLQHRLWWRLRISPIRRRSLRARGAGAPDDSFRIRGSCRPWSVAATASGRMGCAAGGGRRFHGVHGAGRLRAHHLPSARDPGPSAGGHFTGMPTRSLHARGADARAITSGCPGVGGITRFAPPPSRRPRSAAATAGGADGDARWAEAPASSSVGAMPFRWDADAQPARPWRKCAGGLPPAASGFGGNNAHPAPAVDAPATVRPLSVAATAGGRRGMHGAWRWFAWCHAGRRLQPVRPDAPPYRRASPGTTAVHSLPDVVLLIYGQETRQAP
jgi:hypothetical protein